MDCIYPIVIYWWANRYIASHQSVLELEALDSQQTWLLLQYREIHRDLCHEIMPIYHQLISVLSCKMTLKIKKKQFLIFIFNIFNNIVYYCNWL